MKEDDSISEVTRLIHEAEETIHAALSAIAKMDKREREEMRECKEALYIARSVLNRWS